MSNKVAFIKFVSGVWEKKIVSALSVSVILCILPFQYTDL